MLLVKKYNRLLCGVLELACLKWRALVLPLLLAIPTGAVSADTVSAQENLLFNDIGFVIDRQAKVLYQEDDTSVNDYVVALGVYKKRANRWLLEQLQREPGTLSRYTLEYPRDYGARYDSKYGSQELFQVYRSQLPKEATVLFECKQRRCGESNSWANIHFNVKQLYGINDSQYYGVYKVVSNDETVYFTLYSIIRGNGRLYVQLDTFKPVP